MHRLFIAIRPPADVRATLLDTMGGVEGARWQDDDQLHLTLAFVGEVEARRAEDLADALGRVRARRFDLAIAGVDHFEKKGRATALWARVVPSEPLERLHQKVVHTARFAGCEVEHRKFVPHVTLARLNAGCGPVGGFLQDAAGLRAGPWEVESFALFESRLGRAGAQYTVVEEYLLA